MHRWQRKLAIKWHGWQNKKAISENKARKNIQNLHDITRFSEQCFMCLKSIMSKVDDSGALFNWASSQWFESNFILKSLELLAKTEHSSKNVITNYHMIRHSRMCCWYFYLYLQKLKCSKTRTLKQHLVLH